ncbi:class I SAM-dependent methyltransferase [Actinomadura sp. DC4]|uniref:class I SAM-dependent methyltransferase n=1 Tax=Actinomadura sp. DC4 TaxID=3055069 RepID=UPI0025B24690|nr:class I SAM-dependent methyltransferase [Actinomadura sp. DC4]MDN3351488.1 methyltransferase domain-containing protein [Actinomadura sp. DC4]
MDGTAPEIIDYYTSVYDEASRLSARSDGRLEFLRTQELLRRHLPAPPAGVLDVGGGPGVHARWLVADGYAVHLVDPVERHLRQAESSGCGTELGDARSLTAADANYDAVLLLGPLYHLTERDDRVRALREARRVLRPGGTLAVAAISRHAALLDLAAIGRLDRDAADILSLVLATGRHDDRLGFTTAYFHTVGELRSEVTEAGFAGVRIYGVEGPAWPALKGIEVRTGESLTGSPLAESALLAARIAESDPALLAASSHLLAVAQSSSQT